MCGINGFNFKDEKLIRKMMSHTKNRGPDFNNFIQNETITIGHDRLSILDLNERSNQPFCFKNLILSFNGEIYNYRKLRDELVKDGYIFKTTSDTEVVIYLFHKYGFESFKMLSGIFAIAIWDNLNETLYLVRDIVGVKPLYYSELPKNKIIFSSSIKSILSLNNQNTLNEKALFYYKNIGRNEGAETFFSGIFKLLPGQILIQKKNLPKKIFKLLHFNFKKINTNNSKENITNIIKSQFISDVPIALSLSGGFDSNIIYKVMRENLSKKKYQIYSFYFHDYEKFNKDFNTAKKNCKNFGDSVNQIEISFKEYQDNIEKVLEILEEPISNQCSILNYVMAKNIKEKVIMTGDGGDEIFGGYDHYKSAYVMQTLSKINIFKNLFNFNTKYKNFNRLFYKNSKEFFVTFNEGNLMKDKHIYFKNFENMSYENIFLNHCQNYKFKNSLNDLLYLDIDTKIPNDFMRRNDNIFMNFGIEARVPYLDQNMIENYLFLSENKKYNYLLQNKGYLKKIFKNNFFYLKEKHGLQSPLAKWMKNQLQPFIKEILSESYYEGSKKIFNFSELQKLIKKHKESYYNPDLLWSCVCLQVFFRKFRL